MPRALQAVSPTIREWPVDERPRERLASLQAADLATRELLAILVGVGSKGRSSIDVAGDLLDVYEGSLRRLARADAAEITAVRGIGEARAARIVAAMELGRRLAGERGRATRRVRGPRDVFLRLGSKLRDSRQEEFWALYLDTQNRIRLERRLTVGLLNSSLVHPREVFAPAITGAAASIIVVHNHPSGDPEPSAEDLAVTAQLMEAGCLLGIPVRDHVILGDSAYVSLAERGTLASR
ncbi:MAG: DNA repair protein RadC [Gemmatimonadales bacterium]